MSNQELHFAHPQAWVTTARYRRLPVRMTITWKQVGDLVTFGVAFCSPNDMFSKRIGRAIASGRCDIKPSYIKNVDSTWNSYDILNHIKEYIQQVATSEEENRNELLAGLPDSWKDVHWPTEEKRQEAATV